VSEGGALSDESYAALVDESCSARADVCVAWLADWRRTRPDSASLAARLRSWHETKLGEPIPAEDVHDLATLLVGAPAGPTVSPEAAARATALARRYASFGVPFDNHALIALWSRCRPAHGSDACERGLTEAVAAFGG
jgi:hypothetical protein